MQFPKRAATGTVPRILGWTAAITFATVLASGDGKVLAAPPDGNAGTPTQAKAQQPRRLEGKPRDVVLSLAFSPDGTRLVAGARDDATVPVWDLTTNKLLYELPSRGEDMPANRRPRHEGPVEAVAHSPDGTMIATGCGFQRAKGTAAAMIFLWDSKNGKLIREIPAHPGGVYALAFSPNSKQLLSGGGDRTARLWDVASGKEVQQFMMGGRSDQVRTVGFFPDGKTIAFEKQCDLVYGEVESGRTTLRSAPEIIRSYPPGFQTLASGKLFRIEAAEQEYVLRSYSPGGTSAETRWRQPTPRKGDGLFIDHWAASPDGKTMALCEERGLSLWSVVTNRAFLVLDLDDKTFPHILAFSPDGKTLAVGLGGTSSILLWNVSRMRLDVLWGELAVKKDAEVEDSVKDLAALPKEAVPYLAERLQRLANQEEQVGRLAKQLDDDDFEVREKASRQLRALGREAEFALEAVLKNKPSAEVSKRVTELLAAIDIRPTPAPVDPKRLNKAEYALWLKGKWPPKMPDVPKPSEVQALKRAFATLENFGTPEARQLVKKLAETAPEGLVREEARAVLQRFSKAGSPRP